MKKRNLFFAAFMCMAMSFTVNVNEVFAQTNYDESKVPQYTIPDVLTMKDGTKVTNANMWKKRRAEVLDIFTTEMFGQMPPAPKGLHFKQIDEDQIVYDGLGIRRTILVCLDAEEKHTFEVMINIPANHTKPVPAFVGLNFKDNLQILTTPQARRWPIKEILKAGFAVATAAHNSIEPDSRDVKPEDNHGGVREWYESMYPGKYTWGAISAWSWGLSRIMDYFQKDKDIDATKVVVIGHSRLGKTALWTGANDKRFAIMISNNSGCCGAATSRRRYGETFASIQRTFPYWFSPNFFKYDEDSFPLEQNALVALSAPRPVYIASAEDDKWADPKGEWLTAKNVQPVYDLFGKQGLQSTEWIPADTQDDKGTVAYKLRTGVHDLNIRDWVYYLEYAKRQFGM